MQIPEASAIEEAALDIPKLNPKAVADQLRELHEAVGEKSPDFDDGFTLGVQSARRFLLGSTPLILANINPQSIL